MFEGMKNASCIFKGTLKVFVAYPSLIWPLLLTWALYAPTVVYLYFVFPWDDYPIHVQLLTLFAAILFFSLLLSASCFVLLEQIRRIETGRAPGIATATGVASRNVMRALPVTLGWAFLWFLITVLEMTLFRRNEDTETPDMTPQNVAQTLAGYESVRLSRAFFDALKKGVRMIAFLIFPAIAWGKSRGAVKRGISVAATHKSEFAAGFILTELAAAVAFLPSAIIFLAASRFGFEFPDWVWFATIIYTGFAWSFSMLLEQLFAAELYLWHMMWEAKKVAAPEGQKLRLEDVRRPSLLDGIPNLAGGAGKPGTG